MSRKRNPQLAPAAALVQLLQEHPDLPTATWTIDTEMGSLRGHLHGGGFESLSAYASVLGGEIAPEGADWEFQGRVVRTHTLSAVWRDVRVLVAVVLPVGAAAAGLGRAA